LHGDKIARKNRIHTMNGIYGRLQFLELSFLALSTP
jgi:hypothetical protein